MADDTVTIRAELIDDISAKAAQVKAQLGALAASVGKLDAVSGAAGAGGLSKVTKGMNDLNSMGQKAGKSISDFADTIGSKLVSMAERGAVGLGALALAAGTVGVKFTASMQQSQLALNTFFGSAQAGGVVMGQLKALLGPVGIGQLTQGVTSLETAGADPNTVMAMMRSLANVSAVSQNPGATFDTLSQAVNRIQETGMLEPRALMGFLQNGVDVYGLLSQEMGIPRDQVKRMLQTMNSSGGSMTAPANFLNDLSSMNGPMAKFSNGLDQYRKTIGGMWGQIKIGAQEALSAMTTPLTDWLGREAPKVIKWEDDVKTRFGLLGGLLGKEWSSGNTSGFAATLGTILGAPGLASVIQPVASAIQSLVKILRTDVIPIGRDLMAVAVPALHALADVLGFLGDHAGITQGVVLALAGFLTLVKVGSILVDIAKGFTALTTAMEAAGAAKGGASLLGGIFGASAPAAAAGGGALGAGEAGAAGAGLLGIGGAALFGGAAAALADLYVGSKAIKAKGAVSEIATIATTGPLGWAYKHFLGGQKKTPSASASTSTTINVHPGAIQVNGAGDPKAVGQAVSQSLADQIIAFQKEQAERGATP